MKLYKTVSRPLYRDGEPKAKKAQNRKYNSVKKIATVRNNTGIVNNADQHISAQTVEFINWLGGVMEDIETSAKFMTAFQFYRYEKISPNKQGRFIARDLARKRKAMFQEHAVLAVLEDEKKAEFLANKQKNMDLLVLQIENDEYRKQIAENMEHLRIMAWVEEQKQSIKKKEIALMEKIIEEMKRSK